MKERFDWRIKVAEIFEKAAVQYIDRSNKYASCGDNQKEEETLVVAQSFFIRARTLRNISEKLKNTSKNNQA